MEPELQLVSPVAEPHATITASEALAAEVRQAIDALFQRIPRLEMPHPLTAPHVRGARTVSRPFLESMIGGGATRQGKGALGAVPTDAIAKGLARDPEGAELVPHLENLKRDLARRNVRRAGE